MANTTVTPAYSIETGKVRSMFGKTTGKVYAMLTGRFGENLAQVEGMSASDARAEMLKTVGEMVTENRPTYLVCGDGKTTLIVFRSFGGWEYEIVDADRTYPTGCLMSCDTRKQAVGQAIAHAERSYGGVLRQLR